MVVVRLGKAQLGWATLPLEPWLATLRLFSLALAHVILQSEAAGVVYVFFIMKGGAICTL
ncbi:hypothetical protein BDV38DRAFT_250723 [Aspergillus pseudotamarii]|uniref:Uncharacterized protein n=1 Tax=Aspergillus pseudotamarii TaxID=132259 RepID=A0A5N6SQ10_ASPPS|nr:uncharacterized protein BDV38DRAFT_250723 [Aspergillus pseudotamarii]KAE8135929.1 hypothetical protein BDV38DRAFT_250723 [Aspergillus pseudotamarii]